MTCCDFHSFVFGSLPTCLATELTTNVGIALSALAGVNGIGGLWLVIRRRREQARANAAPPLQSDWKTHRFLDTMPDRVTLTEEEATLLITMTEELELTSPALLFVEPKYLEARSHDDSDDSKCALTLLPKLYGHVTYV